MSSTDNGTKTSTVITNIASLVTNDPSLGWGSPRSSKFESGGGSPSV